MSRRISIALVAFALSACTRPASTVSPTGLEPDAAVLESCGAADDPDGDTISTYDEGPGDEDGDGAPNRLDDDSDGDGRSDALEAGDTLCSTPPVDSDGDGIPDFLDTDGNGDGVADREQTGDTDGDGIPDAIDLDVDGDGIANSIELGEDGRAVDTDGDGTPDVFDEDSDGDTIRDAHEGRFDPDGDGIPAFRDLDSDGDGLEDAIEAGDGDLVTPPVSCREEIDPATGEIMPDGGPDSLDPDSDNDGVGDGEEEAFGTNRCGVDTDGDAWSDLVEVAYERVSCITGGEPACGCATNPACAIPPDDFYVVLPYEGEPVQRDLDFGTDVRVADVFFLTDTTASMAATLDRVKRLVASEDGIIARVRATIPDVWVGGGQHDDFPLGGWGLTPDVVLDVAAPMTPPERAADVMAAFARMSLHNGMDGPESQTEALSQLVRGLGGVYMLGSQRYEMPRWAGRCLDTGWGAPCFRDRALPIVVHFTDVCSHNGPRGDAEFFCTSYGGIVPEPASFDQMAATLRARNVRYVGVNASWARCAGLDPATFMPGSPCAFMTQLTDATGSVDLAGTRLLYDLSNGATDDATFVDTIAGALEALATRVPFDVDAHARDDAGDAEGVDATRFITARRPACIADPSTNPCWSEPAGFTHDEAVGGMEEGRFVDVVPGTRLLFRLTFQNDFLPADARLHVFVAYVDVRADGVTVLDTRQVFIVVPADAGGLLI